MRAGCESAVIGPRAVNMYAPWARGVCAVRSGPASGRRRVSHQGKGLSYDRQNGTVNSARNTDAPQRSNTDAPQHYDELHERRSTCTLVPQSARAASALSGGIASSSTTFSDAPKRSSNRANSTS